MTSTHGGTSGPNALPELRRGESIAIRAPARRGEEIHPGLARRARRGEILRQADPRRDVHDEGIARRDHGRNQAEVAGHFLFFLDVGAEQAVEDDQHAAEVGVEILGIARVMDAVARRRVDHVLQPAQLGDPVGMDPELVEQVQEQRRQNDFGCEADQHQRREEERRAGEATEPAEAIGGGEIELVGRVMNRMGRPEPARGVCGAVIPVVEEFEADELARERQIQRKEIETRNKTLDALDRFPKALHDSHALLNTILLQRLPKDPPPPRRSRRSSGPEPEANIESSGSPNKKKRARPSQGESTVLDPSPQRDWRDAQSFQDTSLAEMEQQPDEDDERESAPQATARIRTRSVRNVGGWISPNMAKLVDRSWLERDTPVESGKGLNISSYAPQVGEAIL